MEQAREHPKAAEWRHLLLILTGAVLIFETLTGLSIWLLGFSVPNQIMVLVHTGAGLVFLVPAVWYSVRHWLLYRSKLSSHVKLTGYLALLSLLAAVVSGIVLTWQAAFGNRISYTWDLVHIIATVALVVTTVPHIASALWRVMRAKSREVVAPVRGAVRTFVYGTSATTLALLAVVIFGTWVYEPPTVNNDFPDDYSYLYGSERPFAPSLARTSTGGAFDARTLGGSDSCGQAGCHEEVAREWEVSAHRWSAMDPAFRAVQNIMAEQNGPESTRYCGGCHDPVSLFSGTKDLFAEDLTNQVGYDEGVSCIVCHAIKETDVKGNANYVIAQPDRYMFELSSGGSAQWISNFLIRAYPAQHVESLQHKLFKSPEFCAACHKQFIDEEINNVGWVQLQNQYDNWKNSRWNHPGDPTKTIECRECHMPLVDSMDPARGDDLDYNREPGDGKHRSHRFLGANQFMPTHLNLPGGEEQVELTEKWLRGELAIPEIASKWKEGPAVPITVEIPEEVSVGEEVPIEVHITNNKLGHDFPTGPLDIIQAWVEVIVTDDAGQEIFATGQRDADFFVSQGTFMFKAEPVDQYGNLIDRHNLWEMVGVRYRRALFPGFSDMATYKFSCPATLTTDVKPLPGASNFRMMAPPSAGRLHVEARLKYRKIDQHLLNVLFGEDSGLTSPVSVLSEDRGTIRVRG
jgi:hypothetical protein